MTNKISVWWLARRLPVEQLGWDYRCFIKGFNSMNKGEVHRYER